MRETLSSPRWCRAPLALAAWALLAATPLMAQPVAEPAAMATSAPAALDPVLQGVLPAEAPVRDVLTQSPAVHAADAGIAGAQARARRLAVGPYEWNARAAIDHRRERGGDRFMEQEIGLERTLRWPGKAEADQRLGEQTRRVGELARADAWHEAARMLLADWFEALREARAATVWRAQAELAAQQADTVRKRQRAGDAARLDTLAADAEQARTEGAAARAAGLAAALAEALARRYPGLPPLPRTEATAAQPLPAALNAAQWVERILADNHELELAQANAALARQQAERARLDRRGDPTVGMRVARERDGQERVFGVYASLPLGSAGREADLAAALADADKAEQQALLARRRIEADTWRLASLDQAVRADWERQAAARLATQQSAELMARAYSLGEASLAEVLQARRLALDAALATDAAWLDALQSRARLLLDTHQLWGLQSH